MRYFKVTDHTGKDYVRSAAYRVYTHANVGRYGARWSGSLDFARKKEWFGDEIIAVVEITAKEYRAIGRANRRGRLRCATKGE